MEWACKIVEDGTLVYPDHNCDKRLKLGAIFQTLVLNTVPKFGEGVNYKHQAELKLSQY